jgi:hypothetical protein
MTTFYVATRTCYVLVEAADEGQARELGRPGLAALYREQLGREVAVEIHTVRPATAKEIELQKWHDENLASEST